MRHVIKLTIYVFTIVITNPYEGLYYDRITAFDVIHKYRDVDVTVCDHDGCREGESDYQEERAYEETVSDDYDYGYDDYYEPHLMYNDKERAEVYYFQKLFDYYNSY